MRVVIIGSRVAGITVATEMRKKNKEIEIVLLEKSSYLPYSPCSLPYVVAGEIESFDKILTFKQEFFDLHELIHIDNAEVTSVDRKNRVVVYSQGQGIQKLDYDYLVIATGSKPFVPKIKGIDDVNYVTLTCIDDAKKIEKLVKKGKNAVIIGGGFVGIEIAYALSSKGMKATIVESKGNCLSGLFDSKMSDIIQEHFEMLGIKVMTNQMIKQASSDKIVLEGDELDYSLLVLATGVVPNDELAQKIGIKCDKGVIVDDFMTTNDKRVFACGDCTTFKAGHGYMIATNAISQAKIVANNILAKKKKVDPPSTTIITKTGDLILASVGKTFEKADLEGLKPVNAFFRGKSKVEYMSSKKDLFVYLVADKKGKLIGAQIVGYEEVLGRINWVSLAIKQGLSVEDFARADYGYNPPISPVFDPVITCSELLLRKLGKAR